MRNDIAPAWGEILRFMGSGKGEEVNPLMYSFNPYLFRAFHILLLIACFSLCVLKLRALSYSALYCRDMHIIILNRYLLTSIGHHNLIKI